MTHADDIARRRAPGNETPSLDTVSVVIVTHDSERDLPRCLGPLIGLGSEIVVVDSRSTDGSVALVRREFPSVDVIELDRNVGYGGANNVGIAATSGRYVLVLNPDAWPVDDAVRRLVRAADELPRAAVVGPRLVGADGKRQLSIRGFPTLWRLATEFFFVRWFAPGSRALNAFYGAGVDPEARAEVEWLMGAAILLRREALDDVGLFDPAFFMYSDEVDLAYRLREAGWSVAYEPDATFVHLGGSSTSASPIEYYRELLRSHVRFMDKHRGRRAARRTRVLLLASMRVRSLVLPRDRRRIARAAAAWLGEHDVDSLLRLPDDAQTAPSASS